ncbi:hypothetical protein [Cohnella zeiphila]|uniref:Uncharacterized protein n=1 Tax=Cohnella zeiphila TaxID=2761120 RepID=A0A7X0VY19_9BACL|nr:hypothetical protein [Cohnella zeiphila]MBB6732488.1 hypothetical protein [Cohnella zeiphila]
MDDDTNRMFFCVKCAKLLPVDRAQMLFRTGFYRIEFPLGLCDGCLKERTFRLP